MLARMHLAGQDYERHQPNLRGLDWWTATVPVVVPFLNESQAALIQGELAFQQALAHSPAYAALLGALLLAVSGDGPALRAAPAVSHPSQVPSSPTP